MSVIITGDIGPKRYYVEAVPAYTKQKSGRRFPLLLAAAMGLREAKAAGCDEIVVKAEGLRSRTYSVQEVEQRCRRDMKLQKYLPMEMAPGQALLAAHDRRLASGLYL